MAPESGWKRRLGWTSEAILLAMVCLSPWAFGSVEAWAELGLDAGVAVLAILWALAGGRPGRSRGLTCGPSLALAGLVLLALFQVTPLPRGMLRRLAPATAEMRAKLLPSVEERVFGDPGPPVAPTAATISQDPEATLRMVGRLAAAWIVFQCVLDLGVGAAALRRFGLALAGNATLLAFVSLVQMLSWDGKIYGFRASPSGSAGPFVCHNHLAATLNLGLGMALAFFLAADRRGSWSRARGSRLWAGYAVGLIVVGVVASLSRSGFLALMTALGMMIVIVRPRVARLGVGLATTAVLIPVFLYALGGTLPYQRRLSTLLETAPYSDRMQVWRDAARAWPTSPVWGTGLGSFAAATARVFRRDTGEVYLHAENEYLEGLVEGGVVGVVLAVAAVAGIVRMGSRGLKASADPDERALVLGAFLSGLTLIIQSLGDFALHIPSITVAAVTLAAHLCRSGLAAPPPARDGRPAPSRWDRLAVVGPAVALVGLAVLAQGFFRARAEARLAGAGLAPPGSSGRETAGADDDRPTLERRKRALERALDDRPDWAEGHLRLGQTLMLLYQLDAQEALGAALGDPAGVSLLSDPLWLHRRAHAFYGEADVTVGALLTHDAVRRNLVPAARSFLEARRCCPVLARPHAELAVLDYLLDGADPTRVYLERALWLAGPDRPVIALVTQLAIQDDAPDLAARGWRKVLDIDGARWREVADHAGAVLDPEQILDEVATSGRETLRFADRLYTDPEDRAIRRRFLQAAAARLPEDPDLTRSERLALEAEAWARLDEPDRARDRMVSALGLEPRRADWRRTLVEWLIRWGRAPEAHEQALTALALCPGHPDALRAVELAAEALARGHAPPPFPGHP